MGPFELTAREYSLLEAFLRSADQARLLRRAQAILWLAEGDGPAEVAERLGVRRQTLYSVRSRADMARCSPTAYVS
jgi:DNA-binding CsgD family transcriptional regulator